MISLINWRSIFTIAAACCLSCTLISKLTSASETINPSATAAKDFIPAKTDEPIVLDGNLDDKIWQKAIQYDNFITASPDVGLKPAQSTSVQLAYDAEHLYFAIRAYDSEPALVKSAIMGWDTLYSGDYVGVYVDALNDSHVNFLFCRES